MNWRDDKYRRLFVSGELGVGAVYPPLKGSCLWRWKVWVTESGSVLEGKSSDEAHARKAVEQRFRGFLDAAELAPKGGAA
ncbi:hypothetical protein MRS76_20475 [Rhizobiaceae bacterium n13]|uniref:hypothetical protein n=1 Tax=Ferirhizobium litorale TaxID=2927786 RepID=UPI0024B28F8B|nr:hypothetical protein [Fererhizobium litorale]MDI7864318.1 hypothetical protein [Fererhizobium litorale]